MEDNKLSKEDIIDQILSVADDIDMSNFAAELKGIPMEYRKTFVKAVYKLKLASLEGIAKALHNNTIAMKNGLLIGLNLIMSELDGTDTTKKYSDLFRKEVVNNKKKKQS